MNVPFEKSAWCRTCFCWKIGLPCVVVKRGRTCAAGRLRPQPRLLKRKSKRRPGGETREGEREDGTRNEERKHKKREEKKDEEVNIARCLKTFSPLCARFSSSDPSPSLLACCRLRRQRFLDLSGQRRRKAVQESCLQGPSKQASLRRLLFLGLPLFSRFRPCPGASVRGSKCLLSSSRFFARRRCSASCGPGRPLVTARFFLLFELVF